MRRIRKTNMVTVRWNVARVMPASVQELGWNGAQIGEKPQYPRAAIGSAEPGPGFHIADFRGVFLIIALVAGSVVAAAAPLTKLERQRLVAHLEMTESWLVDEVRGLSDAQLRFRPTQEAWSILDVVEHLIVAGPIYWQDLEKALKMPLSDKGRPGKDAEVLWYGIDRSQRQKALATEKPKGDLRDSAAGLETFHKFHARMLAYAKTSDDDLRGHIVERERCDAYQWLLLISTHEQRHILQIREIKADGRFPRR